MKPTLHLICNAHLDPVWQWRWEEGCAAALVFAQHGYGNTDVQFVADALHMGKGTVYRYFPSKEALVFPHRAERLDRFVAFLMSAPPDERPVATLRRTASRSRAHAPRP